MAAYHEAVKRLLSEINKFINGTLSSEILSKPALSQKNKIVEQLQKLFQDYDNLAPDEGSTSSARDGGTTGSLDESRNTADSSHGSEEDNYADNIPATTVKDLTDPIKIGYLDRKQKDLLRSSWQKRYCILHKNILYIFKKPGDKKQQGAFFITGYELREAPQNVKDAAKKDSSFELVCPGKKTYQFLADNKDDLQSWKEAIEKASGQPAENGFGEDGDMYEPLDDIAAKISKSPTVSTSPAPADEMDDLYDDGQSTAPAPAPAPTPDSSSKSFFPSLFSKKDKKETTLPKTDQNQNVKEEPKTDEFKDDELIYEPVDAVDPLPPPPPPAKSPTPETKPASEPSPASGSSPPPVPPHVPKVPETTAAPPPLPSRGAGDAAPPPPLPGRTAPLPPPPTEPLPAIPQQKKMNTPALGKILHPAEDFENMFYGKWACKGSTDDELTFERGEIVHVISRDLEKDNWWIGELNGKIGLVPKSFLSPAYEAVH